MGQLRVKLRSGAHAKIELLLPDLRKWYEVLKRPFFSSSTYVELYRTSTCCGREFFRACVKTRNSFPAHHGGRRLWPLPLPMAQRHPNQAHRRHPHTMGDTACAWFGINPPGGRVVSTTTTNVNVSFCLSIRALLMVHLICLVARHIPPAIIHPPPSNDRERRRCNNQPARRDERGMARRERGGGDAAREVVIQQLAGAREMVAQ